MKTQTVQILTALSVAWTISVLTQSAVQMMTALPTECVLCVRTANVRSLNAVLMMTAIQQHLFAQTTSFAWRAAEAKGCPGYNEVCDATYSNCNYCNATETIEVGSCNPGCITDDNCAGTLVCDGFHQCIPPGVSVNLKQIILVTSACNDCQGTNIENGPILHLKGGEGVDGFPECNTLGLDHEDRVDYAAGSEAVFDEDGDKDVLGTCYRANLDGEVTSGTITWTAEMGTWTLDGNQVDFTWSDASKCKSSCCLDKPLLSPKEPVANLINCKKNCGDNLVC